jgi:hypothetical protein
MSRSRRSRGRPASAPPSCRCAVYTRVSTDHELEQDFNSLDAQREACMAYIRSEAHEGWILAHGRYDDGGYSGVSLNRPALRPFSMPFGSARSTSSSSTRPTA